MIDLARSPIDGRAIFLDIMFNTKWIWLLVAGLLGYVFGNFSAAIVTLRMPKLYESEAVIHVSPPVRSSENPNGASDKPVTRDFLKEQVTTILDPETVTLGYELFEITTAKTRTRTTTAESFHKGLKCQILDGSDDISLSLRLPSKFAARDGLNSLLEAYEGRVSRIPESSKERGTELKRSMNELLSRMGELEVDLELPEDTYLAEDEFFVARLQSLPGSDFVKASKLMELRDLGKKFVDQGRKLEELRNAPRIDLVRAPAVSDVPVSPNIDFNLNIGRISGVVLFVLATFLLQMLIRDEEPRDDESDPSLEDEVEA